MKIQVEILHCLRFQVLARWLILVLLFCTVNIFLHGMELHEDGESNFLQYHGDNLISDDSVSFLSRGFRHTQPLFNTGAKSYNFNTYLNPVFGCLFHKRTDLFIPDPIFPVKIEFVYNSSSTFAGRYGLGWQMNYNVRYVTNNRNGNVIIVRPDDRTDLFVLQKDMTTYKPSDGVRDSLIRTDKGFRLIVWNDSINNYNDYTVYAFESSAHHYITSLEGRNGNKIFFEYNADNSLKKIIYPGGRVIILNYSGNRLDNIDYGSFRKISYRYDHNGNPSAIAYPSSDSVFYGYDDDCRKLNKIYDPEKNSYLVDYDTMYAVRSISFPLDTSGHLEAYKMQYLYKTGQTTAIIADVNTYTRIYTYDSLFRIISITDALNNSEGFVWNSNYCLRESTDKLNNKYKYKYDFRGNIIEVINPLSETEQFAWEYKFNKLLTHICKNGRTETYDYDTEGNILNFSDTSIRKTIYQYDTSGLVTRISTPLSKIINIDRDSLGYVKSILFNDSKHASYTYDEFGNLRTKVWNNNGDTLQYFYDPGNNLLASISSTGDSVYYTYSPNGNLISKIQNIDDTSRYVYDRKNRLIKYVNPLHHSIEFNYDFLGNLVKTSDPLGFSNLFVTDSNYQFSIIYDQYNNKTEIEHDKNGNIISVTDRNGKTTFFGYDALNRPSTISGSRLSSGYQYDLSGNIKEIENPGRLTTSYKFNSINHLTAIEDIYGKSEFIYDQENRLVSFKDKTGRIHSYSYDNFNRLNQITDQNGYSAFLDFDQSGNLTKYVNKENSKRIYGYDKAGRLVSLINPGKDTIRISYDHRDNISSITDGNGNTTFFLYDRLSRLIRITKPEGSINRISYDRNANISQIVNGNNDSMSFFYDYLNRLSAFNKAVTDKWHFKYDNEGNLIQSINPGNYDFRFTYNSNNRLSGILDPAGRVYDVEFNSNGFLKSILFNSEKFFSLDYDPLDRIVTVKDIDGQTSYIYNSSDKVTSWINALNQTTAFSYDNYNRLESVMDAYGTLFRLSYDLSGRLLSLSDASGRNYRYLYNSGSLPVKISNPLGDSILLSYDNSGNLIQIIDEKGSLSKFFYDKENRLSVSVRPLGIKELNIYDAEGRIKAKVNPLGDTTKYLFDASGHLTSTINPLRNRINYVYDKTGNLIKIVDGNGYATQLFYDGLSRISTLIDPEYSISSYSYSQHGNLLTYTNEKRMTYSFDHDKSGRISSITNPSNGITKFSYDNSGNLLSVYDSNTVFNNFLKFNYDLRDRLRSISNLSLGDIELSYDLPGNLKSVKNGRMVTTYYNYDVLNRLTLISKSDKSVKALTYDKRGNITATSGNVCVESIFKYDSLDRLIIINKPGGYLGQLFYDKGSRVIKKTEVTDTTLFIYDKVGRLSQFINPSGSKIQFIYDPNNNLLSLIDGNGFTHNYKYDNNNDFIKYISPEKDTISFIRDSIRNIETAFNPVGERYRFFYTRNNQCNRIRYPDLTELRFSFDYGSDNDLFSRFDPNENITDYGFTSQGYLKSIRNSREMLYAFLSYDDAGNTISTINLTGSLYKVMQSFDDLNRLKSLSIELNEDNVFTAGLYTYNNAGFCTSISDSIRRTTTYFEHDSCFNIKRVTDPFGNVSDITYDHLGRRISIDHANKTRSEFKYNGAGKISRSLLLTTTFSDTLYRSEYFYDGNGNIIKIIENKDNVTTFSYNKNGLMTGYTENGREINYKYDKKGCRIEEVINNESFDYQYESDYKLQSTKNKIFTYDTTGNVVSVHDGNGWISFEYDKDNRVTKINSQSKASIEFTYVGKGYLAKKSSPGKTYYLSLATNSSSMGNIIQEHDEFGNIQKYYDIIPDKEQTAGCWLNFTLNNVSANPVTYYIHTDAFGNPKVLTDKTGNIIHKYNYNPFGELSDTLDNITSNFKFNGFTWIDEIGLYIKDGRIYDPSIGRFYSKDPQGMHSSINGYQFRSSYFSEHESEKHRSKVNPLLFYLENPVYNYNIGNRFLPLSSFDILKYRTDRLFTSHFNRFINFNINMKFDRESDSLQSLKNRLFSKKDFLSYFKDYYFPILNTKPFQAELAPTAISPVQCINIDINLKRIFQEIESVKKVNEFIKSNQFNVEDLIDLPEKTVETKKRRMDNIFELLSFRTLAPVGTLQPDIQDIDIIEEFMKTIDPVFTPKLEDINKVIPYRGLLGSVRFDTTSYPTGTLARYPASKPDFEFINSYMGYETIMKYAASMQSNKFGSKNDSVYGYIPGRNNYDPTIMPEAITEEHDSNLPLLPFIEEYEIIGSPGFIPENHGFIPGSLPN